MKRLTTTLCLTIAVFLGSAGVSVGLPKCDGSYKYSTWTNCVGVYTFPDGTKYFGKFFNQKFHGKGRLVHPKRGTVVCEFENGKVKGKCALEKPEAIWKT